MGLPHTGIWEQVVARTLCPEGYGGHCPPHLDFRGMRTETWPGRHSRPPAALENTGVSLTYSRTHTHTHTHSHTRTRTRHHGHHLIAPSRSLHRGDGGGGGEGGPGCSGGLWESPIRSWPLSPPRGCSHVWLLGSEAHEISWDLSVTGQTAPRCELFRHLQRLPGTWWVV